MESKSTVKTIINILILFWWVCTFAYIILIFSSYKHWFHYDKIVTTKPIYAVGEDVYFRSFVNVKADVPTTYSDVLFCDFWSWELYQRFDDHTSNRAGRPIMDYSEKWTPPRRWTGTLPKIPATCVLYSTIEAYVWYGVVKVQHIASNEFIIK